MPSSPGFVPLLLLLPCLLVAMETGELVHLSVLFRHGHRSPMTLLPGENFSVANTWTDGLGQLTNIGKQNEFELGQFLRKRYGSFLGGRYNSSWHWARSTDVDRTLMSAQACLAGLFPPEGAQRWSGAGSLGLQWQPIPVHTVPAEQDFLLGSPEFPCPERDRQFARVYRDPRRLALYQPYAEFMRRLSNGSGLQVGPDNVHQVLDTLWIDRVAGLPSPGWLDTRGGADWQRLVAVGSLQWREYSWSPGITRFGSGVLLDTILDTMRNLSLGRQLDGGGRKLRMYSDHDTSVASVLAALGNRDFVWPNFASCLMFELHAPARGSGNRSFSVRVWFRNSTSVQPQAVPLANCSDPCPLDKVLAALQPMRLTPQQLLRRCQRGGGGFVEWSLQTVLLATLAGLLALACAATVLMVACRACRRRRRAAVVYRSLADDVEG